MTAQPRYALPVVPPGLEGLADMALDLRWSWSHSVDEVWNRLDPELWEITHNPWHILQTVAQTRLEEFAADPDFLSLVQHHVDERRDRRTSQFTYSSGTSFTQWSISFFLNGPWSQYSKSGAVPARVMK